MKINIKIISLLLIICLLSLSVVCATDDNQTEVNGLQSTDDIDNVQIDYVEERLADTATVEVGTRADLNNKIQSALAGNIVDLEMDYEIGQVIPIDKEITLDGHGHSLDGKNSDRILVVRTTGVTLQNIIFKNGKLTGDSGAAVLGKEVGVTFINCTFINNMGENGGAYYSKVGGNIFINCTFDSNTATNSGGAINLNNHDNKIINCTFKNNNANSNNGGAITITGNNADKNILIGNTFKENNAIAADAGALYIDNGINIQIENNVFIKNTGKRGGAISLYETGYFTLLNNTFTNNVATALGGAMRANIANSNSASNIEMNTFKNNQAPNSGALHIDGSNVKINVNAFDNNHATTGYAGSVQVNGNVVQILNNNFTNTSAKTNGGAIVVKTGPSITIQSNNIINANAKDGGAIHVESGVATIDSNNFINCYALNRGGAIKSDSQVIVTENTFKDNTATDRGSDILIYYSDSKISQIKNNDFVTYTAKSIVTFSVPVEIQDNKGFKETLTIETLNKNYVVTTTTKYLTVVLKNSKGTGVVGKTLTITLNGKTYTGTTDINGKYKTKITLSAVKKYSCTVTFAGDETNIAAKNSFYLYVNKAATKITSPAKTFKKSATKKVVITLKSGKKLLAKKKVSLKINGKIYKGTTNAKGKATIKIKITKKGSFKGTIKYAGDKIYKACTGKVTVKIK